VKLLISLHDVSPAHWRRLRIAEDMFDRLGIGRLTYLLVPDYHHAWDIRRAAGFAAWCRGPHPAAVQWFLHGYVHQAPAPPTGRFVDRLKQYWLTDEEGEFLSLDAGETGVRLEAGVVAFEDALGSRPDGFVAPAWLANQHLAPALKAMRITFTEDHRRVYDLQRDRWIDCPVITWATRTVLRKYGSLLVCPALLHRWADRPVLRIALHPADFDHLETRRSIESVLARALELGTPAPYAPALFQGPQLLPPRYRN
jgi:uncharacterized protein